MTTTLRDATDGWMYMIEPYINLGSSGPTRVETDQPNPNFAPRPVGFTANIDDPEPLLWDGDDG